MKRLRPIYVFIAGWSICAIAATASLLASPLLFLDKKRRLAPAMLRFFGKAVLKMSDVQMHIENEERLHLPGGAILSPNHSSTLDTFVFTALLPRGGTALAKHTFVLYPFVGQGAWLLGLLFIKRGHSNKARNTIAKAAERIRREKLKVMVAPEGTRSKDGNMGPFKKGAFHMALQAKVPIIPIVIHGAHDIQPHGMLGPQRGDLYIRVLEPIDVTHLTPEDSEEEITRIRNLMQAELEQLRQEHPSVLR